MPNIKNNYSHIGILSAMPEEIGKILQNLKSIKSSKFGDLELFSGKFTLDNSKEILLTTAWSGWGKVSAARATTRLLTTELNSIPIDLAIFTGVAGAIDPNLKQWDIILADALIQHDMDARPIFEKHVIPALNKKKLIPNSELFKNQFVEFKKKLNKENLSKFGSLYKGLIATGDMFISNQKKINQISKEIDGVSAVEMEGAAFAQVATQEKVDWLVMRIISDEANKNASNDFNQFLNQYKTNSYDLIRCFINALLIQKK